MKRYKLIKEYPGSPKLGFIINSNHLYYGQNYYIISGNIMNPSKYPEFWEEVVERDFEILSFIHTQSSVIFNKCKDGKFSSLNFDKGSGFEFHFLHQGNAFKIYSIKRLFDGEIFTIGDRVKYYNKYTKIKSIYYNEHNQLSFRVEGDKAPLTGVFSPKFIFHFEKLKEPIFITEDGVEIFEGDVCWAVSDYLEVLYISYTPKDYKKNGKVRTFSTKEAAEEYILMNKPALSLNDVLYWIKQHPAFDENSLGVVIFIKLLKELVKSKLWK